MEMNNDHRRGNHLNPAVIQGAPIFFPYGSVTQKEKKKLSQGLSKGWVLVGEDVGHVGLLVLFTFLQGYGGCLLCCRGCVDHCAGNIDYNITLLSDNRVSLAR